MLHTVPVLMSKGKESVTDDDNTGANTESHTHTRSVYRTTKHGPIERLKVGTYVRRLRRNWPHFYTRLLHRSEVIALRQEPVETNGELRTVYTLTALLRSNSLASRASGNK